MSLHTTGTTTSSKSCTLTMKLPVSTSAELSVWSIPAVMPSIMGLQTREKTHCEVKSTSNTSLAHATVKKKRITVLLVQNSLDVEHLGPANDNEEHSARRNAEENQPGACHLRSRRRGRRREGREEVRGVRLFLLFFFFLPRPFWRSTCLRRTTSCILSVKAGELWKPAWTSFMYSAFRAFASSSSKKASAEASTGCSTICSTGTSRAKTSSSPMPLCCPTRPCGAGSCRTPGRIPGGGAFCRRNASCWSCSSTSLALAFSGRCALWVVQTLGQGHRDGHPLMLQP